VKAGLVSAPLSYKPTAPFLLAAAYATNGVAFQLNGAGATQAYANFKVLPDLSFNTDFAVQMIYSDDVSETDVSVTTSYAVSNASATAGITPAPNATLSIAALDIRVDALNIVKSASGTAILNAGTVLAENYAIDLDTLGTLGTSTAYAAIDAAFNSPSSTRVAVSSASHGIPVSALSLLGLDVTTPKKRNVLVANTESGVTSYQLFQISFFRPSSTPREVTPPTVVSTLPLANATSVALGAVVSAVFSEPIAPLSVTGTTFALRQGTATVAGSVTSSGATVTFTPTIPLVGGTTYTATLSTGITDLAGNPLAAAKVWSFTMAVVDLGHAALNLHDAGSFTILAASGITLGAAGKVTGNIGTSPGFAASMTGFALDLDHSGDFATSISLTGRAYAADYSASTRSLLLAAMVDVQAAQADGAGRLNPDAINLGVGEIGGRVIVPGLYKFTGDVTITTDVTLSGSANNVWIFQVAGSVSETAAIQVRLTGGAQAKNVFWVTGGPMVIGAAAHMEGIVLSQGVISTGAAATVTGRLFGGTAVTLAAASIVAPPAP
jgi:hypothetical protein